MSVYEFNQMTGKAIEQLADKEPVAILPVSSTEQHGAHLPVGTDCFITEAVLRGALDKVNTHNNAQDFLQTDFLILPSLPYGCSIEHLDYPGTLTFSSKTFLNVLVDIGESLSRSGLKKLVLFSGHGGNEHLMEVAARELRIKGLQVYCIQLYLVMGSLGAAGHDVHAGDVETSIMMQIHRELVQTEKIMPEHSDSIPKWETMIHYRTLASQAWITKEVAVDGVIGDPAIGTAEKGRVWMEKLAESIAKALEAI